MPNPLRQWSRPRLAVAALAALAAAALTAVGVWGLVRGPGEPAPAPSAARSASDSPAPRPGAAPAGEPSTDPSAFARQVAEALHTWDTGSGDGTDQIRDRLISWADQSGEEAAGLAADLGNYLPDARTGRQVTGMAVRQHLTDVRAEVPDGWADAEARAPAGALAPGTVAVTVDATLVREGVWDGRPQSLEAPVALTVFMVCQPAPDQCRALRLSAPGTPLR
ncbi:MAG: hypothetical protein LBK95_00160 [Bifidobacteriaceae bacterium]|jgi:hypothetical protein|nr:hypothetical protein [Bifidobacteriaceae bacterium]